MTCKYTAIIVEPRKHKALHFVLNNMSECLSNEWKIILFHGINNETYSTEIVNKLNEIYNNKIELIKLDIINLNQKTYSELLANRLDIYNYINTEYFLIFQTDSMMFKKNCNLLDLFLNKGYDYIGSPWLICNYQPTRDRDFIGNGGFSLRKTETMLKIIKNHQWDENNEWHEDLYFSKKYDDVITLKPNYELAKIFCVDEVFSPKTMACHKAWCHTHFEHFSQIYPEVLTLKNLQYEY